MSTTQATQLAEQQVQQPARTVPFVYDNSEFSNLLSTDKFEHLQRVAKIFASSSLVPKHFQGNVANCFIGIQMALRLGVDPLMFLQKCYIVHGKPAIEATLAIALANASGVFDGRITYRFEGKGADRSCTAMAVDKASGQPVQFTVSIAMAKADGWFDKDGSKWKTLPDLMLMYRSAMFLIRVHAPETILGLQSVDELEQLPENSPGTNQTRNRRSTIISESELTQQLLSAAPADEQAASEAPQKQGIDWQELAGRHILAFANCKTDSDLNDYVIEMGDEFWSECPTEILDRVKVVYERRRGELAG